MMKLLLHLCWQAAIFVSLTIPVNSDDGKSLVFVFDTTGSMSDDLHQAIEGGAAILQAALNNPERNWKDFIVIPFNDPVVGAPVVTEDPGVFERTLRAITVSGGGDCPEASLGGILKGLQTARPLSYLYVFTDASATDRHLLNQVISEIQERQSKVVFLLTGSCSDGTPEEYQTIASVSGGQVYNIRKDNVEDVLDAVKVITVEGSGIDSSSKERDINILSVDVVTATPAHGLLLRLVIDGLISDFTISLSGKSPTLIILNPKGQPLTAAQLQVVLQLDNVVMVKISDVVPGEYMLNYTSTSAHTIRVRGSSSVDFEYKFTISDVPADFNMSSARPITGFPQQVWIKALGLDAGSQLTSFDFIELNGSVISSANLFPVETKPDLYSSEVITDLPSTFFYIQVWGVNSKGSVFQRKGQSTVSAITSTGCEECQVYRVNGSSQCFTPANFTYQNVDVSGYKCGCRTPQFTGHSTNCTNVNECEMMIDNCHINAVCTDTWGSFQCQCLTPEYVGDGVVCTSAEEMTSPTTDLGTIVAAGLKLTPHTCLIFIALVSTMLSSMMMS